MAVEFVPKLVAVPPAMLGALANWWVAGAKNPLHGLRSAGYAGGEELASEFEEWLRSRDAGPAKELPLEAFNERVSEFFQQAGWGRFSLSSLQDLVAAVDVASCWEPRATQLSSGPACHVTTGALAAFFTTFAPYTVGALEVECAANKQTRCRFLLGPPEILDDLYQHLAQGMDYTTALNQLSAAAPA